MSSELDARPMPLGTTLFIDSCHKVSRKRDSSSEDTALDDLSGLARAVVEMDRLMERRGKRLCAFQQSGTCRHAVPV